MESGAIQLRVYGGAGRCGPSTGASVQSAINAKAVLKTQADARTRTADPFITSEVLYQLSYVGGAALV
jgi:hypothetical protein